MASNRIPGNFPEHISKRIKKTSAGHPCLKFGFYRIEDGIAPAEVFKDVLGVKKRIVHFRGLEFQRNKKVKARLKTFKDSLECARCGIKGKYFCIEVNSNGVPCINLYALKPSRKKGFVEVLMTKDHKVPLCMGGSNEKRNLQTMCFKCNCSIKAKEDEARLKED